jgi:hypothetical protein
MYIHTCVYVRTCVRACVRPVGDNKQWTTFWGNYNCAHTRQTIGFDVRKPCRIACNTLYKHKFLTTGGELRGFAERPRNVSLIRLISFEQSGLGEIHTRASAIGAGLINPCLALL